MALFICYTDQYKLYKCGYKRMDYFFNGVINHDENIIKNNYLVIYSYKMGTLSKVSKPNHFVPLLKKIIYKRKKQSSLISIPAPKKVKLNKIIMKHSRTNSTVTQSMFGMTGRKGNSIFLLFMYFQLLP